MLLRHTALVMLIPALALAQTIEGPTTSTTHTVLQNIRLSGTSAIWNDPNNGQQTYFVFMTTDLPNAARSLVQTNLATPLTPVQSALVKTANAHLTVTLRCETFGLLTMNNKKTGQVHTTGTGEKCIIESLH